MKRLSRTTAVLCCIALILVTPSPSQASSYCPGCKAAVIGAAIAVGVGVGVGIYLVHRVHTSLSGCVQESDKGLSLTAKDGTIYALSNPPSSVKPHQRFALRGHKFKVESGHAFRVDSVSRDYGECHL